MEPIPTGNTAEILAPGLRRFLQILYGATQERSISPGMSQSSNPTQTWPDLAIGLYEKLTGRGAEITYELHNLELHVPSSASPSAEHALWKVNGTVKIRTKDETSTPRG